MIRPYSFDSETIAMLRRLVAATYIGETTFIPLRNN